MPFKTVAKLGKSINRRDVLKRVPGVQTRKCVENIVLEVIKQRRTVRNFKSKDISKDDILKILEAGRYAPSAGNQQPWEFVVVRNRANREKIAHACYDQKWIAEAPVIIVVSVNNILAGSKYELRGEKLYGIQGAAAAIENMLLAAESLGIKSAWIGSFSEGAIALITQCPNYVRPCAVLCFGYSDEETITPPRQNLIEFVHEEVFGNIERERDREHEMF